MEQATPYTPINKVRIVTAASLFDGHDAAINIMRRIIQATGVEVIHLGHDRSVEEICTLLELDSLGYLSKQGLLELFGEQSASFCTACWSGRNPEIIRRWDRG